MHRGAVEMRWARSHAHNALHVAARCTPKCAQAANGAECVLKRHWSPVRAYAEKRCMQINTTQSWWRCAVRSTSVRRLRTGLSSWELLLKKSKGGGAEDLLGHSFLLCVA